MNTILFVWSVVSRVESGGQEAYRNHVFFFSYECSVYFIVLRDAHHTARHFFIGTIDSGI